MKPSLTAFFLILFAVYRANAQSNPILSCYFTWNNPPLSAIEPNLCTHLILIGSCTLNAKGELILPPVNYAKEIEKFKLLMEKTNQTTKILVSITPPNKQMSEMVNNTSRRTNFVKNVTEFLLKNPYDGFDIDWEFPVWGTDGHSSDRPNLNRLVKEMRSAFDSAGKPLTLTAAVSAPYTITKLAYDIPTLNK